MEKKFVGTKPRAPTGTRTCSSSAACPGAARSCGRSAGSTSWSPPPPPRSSPPSSSSAAAAAAAHSPGTCTSSCLHVIFLYTKNISDAGGGGTRSSRRPRWPPATPPPPTPSLSAPWQILIQATVTATRTGTAIRTRGAAPMTESIYLSAADD